MDEAKTAENGAQAKDTDTRIDRVKLLEINEAIRDLDGKLSDLEAALDIASNNK